MSTDSKLIIHVKRGKGDDGYKTFSVRIKEETYEKLEEIASKSGHSRNELISMCLDFALDNIEITEK